MNELSQFIETSLSLQKDKKVDIICKILIEDYNSKFANYQGSFENNSEPNYKNILYIDYSIEDKIHWTLQLKIESYLNCVVKYLDKETFDKILLNS